MIACPLLQITRQYWFYKVSYNCQILQIVIVFNTFVFFFLYSTSDFFNGLFAFCLFVYISAICLQFCSFFISAICLQFSCLHFNCLFTFLYVCLLLYLLFVYIFSCLFTFQLFLYF